MECHKRFDHCSCKQLSISKIHRGSLVEWDEWIRVLICLEIDRHMIQTSIEKISKSSTNKNTVKYFSVLYTQSKNIKNLMIYRKELNSHENQ